MGAVYRRILAKMEQVGWAPPRKARAHRRGRASCSSCSATGSSDEVRHRSISWARGFPVFPPRSHLPPEAFPWKSIEAAGAAGGRCRSYYEPALDSVIDNGNHLILSGNRAVHDYLRTIGSEGNFIGPATTEFAFADVAERANAGRSGRTTALFPGGFSPRAPCARYTRASIISGSQTDSFRQAGIGLGQRGAAAVERLIHPFLLAALNTEPETGARRHLSRRSCARRWPRVARRTARASPSDAGRRLHRSRHRLRRSARRRFRFGQRLRSLVLNGAAVTGLELPQTKLRVAESDSVILAVPPWAAKSLLPDIAAPERVPLHSERPFPHCAARASGPPMLGLIGGTVEWIFSFPDRISVTVSNADRLIDSDRERAGRAPLARCRRTSAILPASTSALADREGKARDLRGHARAGSEAPRRQDAVGQICSSPAIGPPPDCPRPSKARCVPAAAPPNWLLPASSYENWVRP